MSVDQADYTPATVIIQPDEGPVFHAFGDTMQIKLSAAHTDGALAVGLSSSPPGVGPPPHRHRSEDELFFVLEGRYRFLANGEWVEAGPGAVVYTPRGVVHTFQNCGDTVSRAWVVAMPSGFETFFSRCAAVFAEATAGPPDMPRILSICDEHGIEFVPPLGPPSETV